MNFISGRGAGLRTAINGAFVDLVGQKKTKEKVNLVTKTSGKHEKKRGKLGNLREFLQKKTHFFDSFKAALK